MIVYLLWEQANGVREVADRIPHTVYHPKLVDVYAENEEPQRLADEYNETHQYSSQWVTSQAVR